MHFYSFPLGAVFSILNIPGSKVKLSFHPVTDSGIRGPHLSLVICWAAALKPVESEGGDARRRCVSTAHRCSPAGVGPALHRFQVGCANRKWDGGLGQQIREAVVGEIVTHSPHEEGARPTWGPHEEAPGPARRQRGGELGRSFRCGSVGRNRTGRASRLRLSSSRALGHRGCA